MVARLETFSRCFLCDNALSRYRPQQVSQMFSKRFQLGTCFFITLVFSFKENKKKNLKTSLSLLYVFK